MPHPLQDLIDENIAQGAEIEAIGPVPEERIRAAELALGLAFPPSYRDYLRTFGALGVDRHALAGLNGGEVGQPGDVVSFTRHLRTSLGLPEHYIALDFQDGDAVLCIDTRDVDADGEGVVVLVDPVKLRRQGPVVAASILAWWEDYLRG